ncbi:hypothetical protein YC2023_056246 [Brassica napus]
MMTWRLMIVQIVTCRSSCCRKTVKPREHNSSSKVSSRCRIVRDFRSSPPIDKQAAVSDTSLERDNISGVKLLVFNETAPTFSHDIALATVPVRVTEPP